MRSDDAQRVDFAAYMLESDAEYSMTEVVW